MIAPNPAYLLFCNSRLVSQNEATRQAQNTLRGRWHFVLERIDHSNEKLEAVDTESVPSADRLSLLCVVRGLEALEQPSRVSLVTTSRYVNRGLRFGLAAWRESGYTWERFGVQKPIRNADLWKRVATALDFHSVDCRLLNTTAMLAGETLASETAAEQTLGDLEELVATETHLAPADLRWEEHTVTSEGRCDVALEAAAATITADLESVQSTLREGMQPTTAGRPAGALERLRRRTKANFAVPRVEDTKEKIRGIAKKVRFHAASLASA